MTEQERLIDTLRRTRAVPTTSSPAEQEENLRRLVRAALPMSDVSEALRQRVHALETAPIPRPRSFVAHLLPPRLGWTLVAALLLGGVVLPVVQPRWVAAQALRRMEAAIIDVRSAHEVTWRVTPDGGRAKVNEWWYQGGRYRTETDRAEGRIQLFTAGKTWSYNSDENTVTVWQWGPFGYSPSGFTVAAMARDFARWGWRDQIRVAGSARLGGRFVRLVTIERADEPGRSLLMVDAATGLPVRSERQRRSGNRWLTETVTEHRYNEPLSEGLFEPHFPPPVRLIDRAAGRKYWEERLSQGIARQQVDARTVILRDLQVNAEGDVFLLYTAGRSPEAGNGDWEIDLTDDRGTQYTNGPFYQPYMKGNHAPAGDGYVFDGARLEGNWWVPIEPQDPWQPRHFTITFHMARIGPDGKPVPVPSKDGFQPPREVQMPLIATFTLAVERPATALVPEWMPYMAYGLEEQEVQRGQISARATTDHLNRHYEQALKGYQELARQNAEQARKSGEPIEDPQLWTEMGELLHKMGRMPDARAALERAIRESRPQEAFGQMARYALSGLQADLAWRPGRRAPEVTAPDLKGRRLSTRSYRGHVLLIDLWSPWSDELAQQKSMYARYHTKGLAILGVGIGRDRTETQRFIEAKSVPWPQLIDNSGWRSVIGLRFGYSHELTRLPRTILVDRQGIVRHVDLHGSALDQAVAELLAERQ
jgi:outer membrane lipoprotein-sorting protein/peroxiredoxin